MITDLITAAAALGVTKPIAETGCRLIEKLLGEPCKVAGGMIADEIYCWQWQNRIRWAERAKQMMEEKNVSAKVLPPGFLLPILDAAGNIDDVDLRELWASLLVSGIVSDRHRHPAFVQILKQLSSLESRLLLQMAHGDDTYRMTTELGFPKGEDWPQSEAIRYDGFDSLGQPAESLFAAFSLLCHLGLITVEVSDDRILIPGGANGRLADERKWTASFTTLGAQFIGACASETDISQRGVTDTWDVFRRMSDNTENAQREALDAIREVERSSIKKGDIVPATLT